MLRILMVPLALIVFNLVASVVLLSAMRWWSNPYFSDFFLNGAFTAWLDYAFDPTTWQLSRTRGTVLRTIIKSGGASIMVPLWVTVAGFMGAAVTFAVMRLLWIGKQRKLFGDAKWQSFTGAVRAGIKFSLKPDRDSILLGIYYLFGFIKLYAGLPKEGHVSLTAATGSGKGVSFVVPNCLNWRGPLVVFSVKRDVLDAVAAERERMGDKVFVFDIMDPAGKTHRWSGFGGVRIDGQNKDLYDDIQRAMFYIIPETRANNPFWDNAARMVATAIGVMLAETPGAKLTIGEILNTIERHDYEQHLRDMILSAQKAGRPYQQGAVYTVLSWLNNKAEEAAAAVRQNIITAFALWHSPRVDAATSADDFNIGTIRSQNISLFICAPSAEIRRLRPIYTLLFSRLIQENTRVDWRKDKTHRDAQTLIVLDERWALGQMREVDDAVSFVRSAGIRICTVLQTKDQLREHLGKEGASNVFNNSTVELIYGRTDKASAEEVSERIGSYTTEKASVSKPRFAPFSLRQNENRQLHERRLLLPGEVASMEDNIVIAMMRGRPPLKLHRIFWYTDSAFYDKDGAPPPIPALRVKVRRERIELA